MKKATKRTDADELRAEYRLDYSEGRPNRFAEQLAPGGLAVVLDPDVAEVFPSSESVNRLLRSVIQAVHPKDDAPPRNKRKAS